MTEVGSRRLIPTLLPISGLCRLNLSILTVRRGFGTPQFVAMEGPIAPIRTVSVHTRSLPSRRTSHFVKSPGIVGMETQARWHLKRAVGCSRNGTEFVESWKIGGYRRQRITLHATIGEMKHWTRCANLDSVVWIARRISVTVTIIIKVDIVDWLSRMNSKDGMIK
jgi:hypothetical protein